MSYFQGQEPTIDLSDEGLASLAEPERQSEEAPQEENQEATEAQTIEEKTIETELVEETPAPEPTPEGQVEEDKSIKELRKWATQMSMENAELRKQMAAAALPKPAVPTDKETILQKMIDDPIGFRNELKKEIAAEEVAPLRTQLEMTEFAAKLQNVFPELQKSYPILSDNLQKTALVKKAVEIGARLGNSKALQKDPEAMLFLAAKELHGLPKQVDQALVKSMTDQAKASAVAELSKKEAAKNGGLSAQPQNNKSNEKSLSPEDEVLNEIVNSKVGGYFR